MLRTVRSPVNFLLLTIRKDFVTRYPKLFTQKSGGSIINVGKKNFFIYFVKNIGG